MTALDIASLLLALGVGGALGALASAVVSGGRLAAGVDSFDSRLRAYVAARTDTDSVSLLADWDLLSFELRKLVSALRKLRPKIRR